VRVRVGNGGELQRVAGVEKSDRKRGARFGANANCSRKGAGRDYHSQHQANRNGKNRQNNKFYGKFFSGHRAISL